MESRRRGFERTRQRQRADLGRAISHRARAVAALLVLACWAGCTYTVAGDTPAPIEPLPPSFQPAVEYTVADFKFALGGGDMATSIFDGRQLSAEIMRSWQARGYVRSEQYVADGSFSGTADYHLTLHGSQRGETSFAMQVINALTLSLVPYTVTQRYELQYVLEDVRSGARYSATAQAWDKTWVQPFLVLTLPFAGRGHLTTMQRVADDFYAQFHRQGAFSAPPPQVSAEPRLDLLMPARYRAHLSPLSCNRGERSPSVSSSACGCGGAIRRAAASG